MNTRSAARAFRVIYAALAVSGALVLNAAPTHAATITQSYTFSFSGFTPPDPIFPGNAPFDPWSGSFTITYDPISDTSGSLDAFSSNLPSSYGTFVWTTTPFNGIAIGDFCPATLCFATLGTDTAWFELNGGVASYGTTNSLYDSNPGVVTLLAAAVPELSTWAMMTLGLAGIGAMTYRRRKGGTLALTAA
jgi:hypothetical protein